MERETSDFDGWLKQVQKNVKDLDLMPALNVVSQLARDYLGVHIWFVEILGRRWSYIAGDVIDQPAKSEVQRIPLQGDIGAVSDNWEILSAAHQAQLVALLNSIIAKKGK